jgi:hypothetical protein
MDPITYTIPEAAKILKCEEEKILYAGSTGYWEIYVLSSIFHLFYIKITLQNTQHTDDIDSLYFPKDSEVEVPWDEDNRLPPPQQMQLSPECLISYRAGNLDTKVVLKSQEDLEISRIYFGLYNSKGEQLKLKDCKLVVKVGDISKFQEKLKVQKESRKLRKAHSNPIKSPEIIEPIELQETNNLQILEPEIPETNDLQILETELSDTNNLQVLETELQETNSNITEQKTTNKELKQGIKEIWEKEGKPSARFFFPTILKKYINKSGSPITSVFYAGIDAGISYRLSTGTTGRITKKTICNYVSEFKKNPTG